ncbi:MAG: hypothetical protein ACLS4Z_04315 [Christensenellaceae bacterium]
MKLMKGGYFLFGFKFSPFGRGCFCWITENGDKADGVRPQKTDYIRNAATQIIYIIYLIYTLIVGTNPRAEYRSFGDFLLFRLFLTMTFAGKTSRAKRKKTGTAVYVWTKRLIKLFTLGVAVYGICTAVERSPPSLLFLAALMIVGWILQIIFEVLIKILTNRVNFILEGLEADLDNMLKPVRSVGNFFKKVTGKEVAPPKELTKNQLKLKEKVELYRAEQKKKKEEERLRREAEKSAARQLAKEQKRDEKQSVRIESRLLRAAEKQQKSTERETRRAEKELPSDGRDYTQLPAAEDADAETALTSAEESVKKPSLLSRFKNKLTGKPEAELSPEREVFEESETDDETEEPKFFDEDTTLYLESEEEKRLREEAEERLKAEQLPEPPSEPSENAATDETDEKNPNKVKAFFGSVFRRKKH